MIESVCTCGQPLSLPESDCPSAGPCPSCGTAVHLTCAEPLADGAGTGDFDAQFVVERGPHADRIGHLYLLGGVAPITLGKLSTSNVLLPGTNVSRHHATLTRLDFGPSRWQIADNQSTNGLWVNDARVEGAHELADDDLVVVGDYELRYRHAAEPAPVMAAVAAVPAGRSCPSCAKPLGPKAKICTDCGIYTDTGKPLVISKGYDENELAIRCDTWIRLVSWVVWLGLYPVATEAFGTRKPYVVWTTAIVTSLISLVFLIGYHSTDGYDGVKNYMMWVGDPGKTRADVAEAQANKEIDRLVAKTERQGKRVDPAKVAEARREIKRRIQEEADEHKPGEFHAYQLLTNAFLHNPDGVYGFLMHLGGNMLFLLVLGTGVNAMIGNLQTAIIYPVLAVCASLAEVIAYKHDPQTACLGASGAVMGLAGMYLILFPVNKVYMAFWLRVRWKCFYKVWPVRGFWVVLFFIMFDVVATLTGSRDGVGHWAHLGGFIAGMVIALTLLLARLTDARGGDLLSVMLGRRAWALLGKPASRAPAAVAATIPPPPVPAVHATSLNFPE